MPESKADFREFVLAAVVEYECRLVRYTTRMLYGNEDRARDVVQHAFMKLCEQDREDIVSRLGPWLFRVCRNRAIDSLRREQTIQQVPAELLDRVDSAQIDPSLHAESDDLMDYIQCLIGELPRGQQEVVELWSQGLRHDEIAEVVEKNVGAIRGTFHRAIKSLKADAKIRSWLSEMPEHTQTRQPKTERGQVSNAKATGGVVGAAPPGSD